MSSILTDIKHALGVTEDDTSFDSDIMIGINDAFGRLTQLGVGLVVGYQITGAGNQWEEFYTDPRLNGVRTFVLLVTKLTFDPPQTGFGQDAMERQIVELSFRLNVVADYG